MGTCSSENSRADLSLFFKDALENNANKCETKENIDATKIVSADSTIVGEKIILRLPEEEHDVTIHLPEEKQTVNIHLSDKTIMDEIIKRTEPINNITKTPINKTVKVSFKEKEKKLVNNGLLIGNCIFNPETFNEEKYDKRTNLYKNKIEEYYKIISQNEKKKVDVSLMKIKEVKEYTEYMQYENLKEKRLKYEKYIRNVFIEEFRKQIQRNKFNK